MTDDASLPPRSLPREDGAGRPRPGGAPRKARVPHSNAVIWLDAASARILKFEGKTIAPRRYRSEAYRAPREPDDRAAANDLFDELCDATGGIRSILVTGPGDAIERFERYVADHRPEHATRIVGHQALAAPEEARMVALAQWHLTKPDLRLRASSARSPRFAATDADRGERPAQGVA
jgi:hypothetical protein